MDKRARGCAALLALTMLAACGQQATMTCPTVQAGGPGDLRETADQQRATAALLGDGDENAIATTAAVIHGRHPTASTDAIANYLVVAYCPTIAARADKDASEKDRLLAAFAKRARQIVGQTVR
ncbi:hypothetical protein QP166_16500 [Sphingomonas sp. LR60]|uniref:hypothetical protein n=1 Tax=Sphingomonas sp. LR60 TaxID=3050233 RepID=UPI002FDF77FA